MKVLVHARTFLPILGGLERVTDIMVRELMAGGHTVTVATDTADVSGGTRLPYRVERQVSGSVLRQLMRAADVMIVANIPLRLSAHLLTSPVPVVAVHHGFYWNTTKPTVKASLIRFVSRRLALNICCAEAVQKHVDGPSTVIPNCYSEVDFPLVQGGDRDRDIIFAGRLVSDKGGALLLDALARLAKSGLHPTVTFVGDGPEYESLTEQVRASGLGSHVHFAGRLPAAALAADMARHRIVVVPSTGDEGLPLVVVEGLASGCVAVGSEVGGIPEAIGPCGLTFPRGDAAALADRLRQLLTQPELENRCRAAITVQVARHSQAAFGASYCAAIARVTGPAREQGTGV